MNFTYPLKNKDDIEEVKDYLKSVKKNHKDYLMFMVGIGSALRISDILNLQIKDLLIRGEVKDKVTVKEKKTGKTKRFAVSPNLRKAIEHYLRQEKKAGRTIEQDNYIFYSRVGKNRPITRQRAVQILDEALDMCGLGDLSFGSHGMRKTWTYFAWKQGTSMSYLMKALNHSSEKQVLAYIGIEEEEMDKIFISVNL